MGSEQHPLVGQWIHWHLKSGIDLSGHVAKSASGRAVFDQLTIYSQEPITAELLRSLPLGRFEALANGAGLFADADERSVKGEGVTPAALRLRIPETRRKPDSFYKAVAKAFTAANRGSDRPAALIAEVNDVPVSTVHRWVKEARRRGLLAPGRRPSK